MVFYRGLQIHASLNRESLLTPEVYARDHSRAHDDRFDQCCLTSTLLLTRNSLALHNQRDTLANSYWPDFDHKTFLQIEKIS